MANDRVRALRSGTCTILVLLGGVGGFLAKDRVLLFALC